MGIEKRGNQWYHYKKSRDGTGKVRSEYAGPYTPNVRLTLAAARYARAARHFGERQKEAYGVKFETADEALYHLHWLARTLTRATLFALGFYKRKGEWRRRGPSRQRPAVEDGGMTPTTDCHATAAVALRSSSLTTPAAPPAASTASRKPTHHGTASTRSVRSNTPAPSSSLRSPSDVRSSDGRSSTDGAPAPPEPSHAGFSRRRPRLDGESAPTTRIPRSLHLTPECEALMEESGKVARLVEHHVRCLESGHDVEVSRELKRVVLMRPDLWALAGEESWAAARRLVEACYPNAPHTQQTALERMDADRASLGYTDSPPIARLLIDCIAIALGELRFTWLVAANVKYADRLDPRFGPYWDARQAAVERRLREAVVDLSRVRKLTSNTKRIQASIALQRDRRDLVASTGEPETEAEGHLPGSHLFAVSEAERRIAEAEARAEAAEERAEAAESWMEIRQADDDDEPPPVRHGVDLPDPNEVVRDAAPLPDWIVAGTSEVEGVLHYHLRPPAPSRTGRRPT